MSVAVSAVEQGADGGVVWAGTEPSALFRSEDGGWHWQELPALRNIPSAPTWSFPPRPWTSHVRWITPDPHEAERIFVGIELGGVMRSLDRRPDLGGSQARLAARLPHAGHTCSRTRKGL